MALARRKFPGAPASLDALCRRFGIDLAKREKHGALLDSELLAEVYLELIGGRQPGFGLAEANKTAAERGPAGRDAADRIARPPRAHQASEAELAAHRDFLDEMEAPIWRR